MKLSAEAERVALMKSQASKVNISATNDHPPASTSQKTINQTPAWMIITAAAVVLVVAAGLLAIVRQLMLKKGDDLTAESA